MAEERRISPVVVIVGGLGLGLAAVVGITALAWAAPPPGVIYCPYCGAGPFATLEEVNEHILAEHPGEPLIIHIEWE
ncbi:hypothetical protein ES703_20799 [subsurface metagenome]